MTLSVAEPRSTAFEKSRKPSSAAGRPLQHCAHCGFTLRSAAKQNQEGLLFCCYGCAFTYQLISGGKEGKQVSWIMVKLGISAFLAMNVMGFALALHSSSIYPDFYQNLSRGGRAYDQLLRYFLLFMSAPVLFLIGVPLFENMINEARQKRWGIDGFIGISVLAAFGYSLVNTFRGAGAIYYDIAVMVLVFLTLGRYLEARFRFKASQSLGQLLEDQKPSAAVWKNGMEAEVSAEALNPGDLILLRAGNRVPVDGKIQEGAGVLEMAAMTGEFLPSVKTVGDTVWAGAILTEGFIKLTVTHPAKESWMERLRQTLHQARDSKAPIEYAADRVVFGMTWLTAAFSLLGFYLGFLENGFMAGMMRALAVLVIVCPCALGAAIPLALWKSFESIASRGILFKDLSRLEMLSKIKGVFFDKTGTLTEALPALAAIHRLSALSENELLQKAASMAQVSHHPFSKAIVREALTRHLQLETPAMVETKAGEGISGELVGIGVLRLGNLKYMNSHAIDTSKISSSYFSGASVLGAWGGAVQAVFVFDEILRPEVRSAVDQLNQEKIPVMILTGDSGESSRKAALALKVPVESGLTPAGKIDFVRGWEKKHGPALVIGEGLNDAPMLAGAGVSLAIGGALEKTREAADFVLPDNDLSRVPWLIHTARRAMRKIRGNLFWAFFYNLTAVPLAVLGKINPVIAALLMIFSSLFIVIHSLNLKNKE